MLEVLGLTKKYGDLVAANNVSFALQPGDIFGFIGSNGAGKTTTIRMISTLLDPTSGTALLNGVDVVKDPMQIRRMIGYMPDFFGLYDDVKVWEYLDFFANIYAIPVRERSRTIGQVLELTDLSKKRDAFVQTLSRGMQQRLCLARCLVHDPALLLLDEPASGLDPRARSELKELILELGQMGKIIIVSSHILPELEGLCNVVGIIEQGNLLAFGPVEGVTRSVRTGRTLSIHVISDVNAAKALAERQPFVREVVCDATTRVGLSFDGTMEDQADFLAALIDQGVRVVALEEDQAGLQDAFLHLTKGDVN